MKSNSETISLHYSTEDPYRVYGINHFIQKYGIQSKFNAEAKINVIYGSGIDLPKSDKGFNVQIVENEMENKVTGSLITDTEKLPLFEKPFRLNGQGESLVLFVDDEGNELSCVVSKDDNTIIVGFDIFNEVGHILAGYLESFWKVSENRQLAKIPVVDYYEKILFDCLLLVSRRSNTPLTYKPYWPDGKEFVLCLTHDVDRVHKTYQYVTHILKYLKKRDLSAAIDQLKSISKKLRGDEPYWNFEKIIEIEKEVEANSSFFFLNEKGKPSLNHFHSFVLFCGRYKISSPKILSTINKIKENGWGIGVHGSYNSYKNKMMLREEKKELETLTKTQIQGIRQHYLNLKLPETWIFQEEVGFKYDLTLGFKNGIGFRGGTSFPFHPFDPETKKELMLLEIPMIIMDVSLVSPKNAWNECKEIIETVEKIGGLLTINWHQEIFELSNMREIYEKILNFCKERGAWLTNADEIGSWMDTKRNMVEVLVAENDKLKEEENIFRRFQSK